MLFRKKSSHLSDDQKREKIDAVYNGARRGFSGIPEISADEVMQRQSSGEELLLVDVRTPKEQQVSKIPGAITIDEFEANLDQHAEATVVCYCTIGGRSGQKTAQLREHGVNAHNMPGSVLSWSHAGGSFVDESGEACKRAHVYNSKFDLLADGYESVW